MNTYDVAIIGAGIAGVAAAKQLQLDGVSTVVLEKSRGPGGRAATRRLNGRPADHGAQFFTARSREFRAQVEKWCASGICREWTRGISEWRDGQTIDAGDGHPRFICPGGMTSLAKEEASGLELRRETKVVSVERAGSGFLVVCDSGLKVQSRAVLSTAPGPQTLDIVRGCCDAAVALSALRYSPCFSAIFDVPDFYPPWPALRLHDDVLSWVAADNTRRVPPVSGNLFVLHSSPAFGIAHLEEAPVEVAERLRIRAVSILCSSFESALILHAHRWRYARVMNPIEADFLKLGPMLAFAGDAFRLGNIESAWRSGQLAALSLRESLKSGGL